MNPVWAKYPGLVWSNRQAKDGVRIRTALARPRFDVLLDAALAFGPDRLEAEWQVLKEDALVDVRAVEPTVARIMGNIRRGYEHARA